MLRIVDRVGLRGAALCALCTFALMMPAPAPAAADTSTSEELIYWLQYLGSDYGVAVRNDQVVDAAEYREMIDLAGRILERYDELRPGGPAHEELARLGQLIGRRAPSFEVRALSREIATRIVEAWGIEAYPVETPDLERGRVVYRENCAQCHGVTGDGDGPSSPGMSPRPTSFREQRIALYSPHQVWNAANFGLPGTGMPAYRGALSPHELWDVAFLVMTMREGFSPNPPVAIVPVPIKQLAAQSDEELLKTLRASRPEASASELDYYRGQFLRSNTPHEIDTSPVGDSGLKDALALERVFTGVAEKVFPSVVGVSVYAKVDGKSTREGWQEGDEADRQYPGFHRVRSGTGFIVSGDGYVLTGASLLAGRDATRSTDIFDVELTGNVHCRARVIGVEPTIDLAVLWAAAPVMVRPVTIGNSDTVRVGQWAIAVGDPPGPESTFATGMISGGPERQCYQENRTSTLFQTSAAIGPSGFGGPLVNIRGEVVGVTTPSAGARAEPFSGGSRPVNALPINLALTIYSALRVKESERSPWIGISVLELTSGVRSRLASPPLTGIYIDDVFDPSPASRSDIRVGDVLTKMNDHRIVAVGDFQTWLYLLGIDTPVTLEISREGTTLRKSVTIAPRPESAVPR